MKTEPPPAPFSVEPVVFGQGFFNQRIAERHKAQLLTAQRIV